MRIVPPLNICPTLASLRIDPKFNRRLCLRVPNKTLHARFLSTIFLSQVYGEKDADGFYWGECRGRRGYVPYNMVEELKDQNQPGQPGRRGPQSDRWGDIYASVPMKKMIALYDYDPHELSPNVDAVRLVS